MNENTKLWTGNVVAWLRLLVTRPNNGSARKDQQGLGNPLHFIGSYPMSLQVIDFHQQNFMRMGKMNLRYLHIIWINCDLKCRVRTPARRMGPIERAKEWTSFVFYIFLLFQSLKLLSMSFETAFHVF